MLIVEDDPYRDLYFEDSATGGRRPADSRRRCVGTRGVPEQLFEDARAGLSRRVDRRAGRRSRPSSRSPSRPPTSARANSTSGSSTRRAGAAFSIVRRRCCGSYYQAKRDVMVGGAAAGVWRRADVAGSSRRILPLGDAAAARRRRGDSSPRAVEHGVVYVAGQAFFVNGSGRHFMRLSFSAPPPGSDRGRRHDGSRQPCGRSMAARQAESPAPGSAVSGFDLLSPAPRAPGRRASPSRISSIRLSTRRFAPARHVGAGRLAPVDEQWHRRQLGRQCQQNRRLPLSGIEHLHARRRFPARRCSHRQGTDPPTADTSDPSSSDTHHFFDRAHAACCRRRQSRRGSHPPPAGRPPRRRSCSTSRPCLCRASMLQAAFPSAPDKHTAAVDQRLGRLDADRELPHRLASGELQRKQRGRPPRARRRACRRRPAAARRRRPRAPRPSCRRRRDSRSPVHRSRPTTTRRARAAAPSPASVIAPRNAPGRRIERLQLLLDHDNESIARRRHRSRRLLLASARSRCHRRAGAPKRRSGARGTIDRPMTPAARPAAPRLRSVQMAAVGKD